MKNLSAKIFIGFILLVLQTTFTYPIFAQTQEELENLDRQTVYTGSTTIDLELKQRSQNPGDNSIKFDLIIEPKITTDRAQLIWNISGVSGLLEGERNELLSLTAGVSITKSIVVVPSDLGITQVSASVIAFQIDGQRTAAASKAFASSEDGSLLLPGADQALVNISYRARVIATYILSIILIVLISFAGYRAFKNWLATD